MSYRVVDTLAAVREAVPEALVPASAWPGLERLAALVPDGPSQLGFEVRLGAAGGPVDLGIALEPGDDATRALAGGGPAPLAAVLGESEPWRRLRELAAAWREPGSRLARFVPFLFLELDAASAAEPAPAPSVFVALDAPLADDGAATALAVAEEAAFRLLAPPPGDALRAGLARCFAALPEHAFVAHLGVMLGRGASGVRLSLSIARAALPGYLPRIGWPHPTAELERCLARYEPESAHARFHAQVDFDLDGSGERIGPRLGLGLRPLRPEGWPELLDRLVADGRCTPAHREALLAWPGASVKRLAGYGFPCRLRRDLSHVKLALEPGSCAPEAKAYLSVSPRSGFF